MIQENYFSKSEVLTAVLIEIQFYQDTRAVQKVSSRFEYLEKRSHGLSVIWQPVREDLTVHP